MEGARSTPGHFEQEHGGASLGERRTDARTSHTGMADPGEGAAAERPMRRSRMLSDDARLALQLQDEELKAARGMKRPKASAPAAAAPSRASEPPAAKKPKTHAEKSAGPASEGGGAAKGGGRGASKAAAPAIERGGGAAAAKGKAASSSPHSPPNAKRSGAAKTLSKAPARSGASGGASVASDSVSFTLEPWPSAPEEVPPLRRSSMTLQEDQTVLNIKRRVVEEAYPGTDVCKVEIRTPSGIKCGQDHSLKYVRSFLWPVSKGDLVLYYCLAADSFL